MALPIEQELKNLSYNAKVLLADIDRGALVTDEDIVATALGRVFNQIQGILLRNLRAAIRQTKEFNTPELAGHLEIVFSNPDIIRADLKGRLDLFSSASAIAGDWNDLEAGIVITREALGLGLKNDAAQRSELWKAAIYRPAREGGAAPFNVRAGRKAAFRERAKAKYERTIETRQDVWGELAPYWLFLNYGNAEAPFTTGGTPYPNNGPTYFIENTEDAANPILRDAIVQVNREMENIILQELEAFERRRIRPLGQVVREFLIAGQPYKLHITPKRGLLGIRKG